MEGNIQSKLFGVSDNDLSILRKECNKSEQDVEDGVKLLLKWYKSQPHFPQDPYDIETIKRYYGSTKFNIESTKSKIDKQLTARKDAPEFFKNRDPLDPNLIMAMDVIQWVMSPKLTPENHRIFIMRYTDGDYGDFNYNNCFKVIFMEADLRMRYDSCLGDIFIWDFTYFKLTQALKVTPMALKKIFYITQDCYGARIKSIHLINCPIYAQALINLIKPLLKKKIANRIFNHGSLEELHRCVSPEYLPTELGGINYTCKEIIEMYKEAMQSEKWRKWYIESESKVVDEAKRPVKNHHRIGGNLGVMGSFRKLNID